MSDWGHFVFASVGPAAAKGATGKYPPADSPDLVIEQPKDGQKVKPGEKVSIKIRLGQGLAPPRRLLILTPQYTFEDRANNLSYVYTVPPNVPPGPLYIAVLAVWNEDKKMITVSQSVSLPVAAP